MTLRTFYQPMWEVGALGPSAFKGYSALKQMGLVGEVQLQDLPPATASTLKVLQEETHPEIFSASLFALANRLEVSGKDDAAHRLYQGLQLWSPDSNWGKQAAKRSEVLNGGGSWGEKVEHFVARLLPTLAKPADLGGMYVGLRVFRGASWGIMKFLGSNAWSSRAAATLGAFFLEVPAFALTQSAIRHQIHPSHPILPSAEELGHLAFGLASLKGLGLIGAHGVASLGLRGISHPVLPQTVMLLGVLGTQGLEQAAGLRKFKNTEAFLTQGLATYLHFNLAGAVLGPLLPKPGARPIPKQDTLVAPPAWAAAVAYPGPVPPIRIAAKTPWVDFTQVYAKGKSVLLPLRQEARLPSSNPPPVSSEFEIPFDESPQSSGIRPAGKNYIIESLKTSFGSAEGGILFLLQGNEISRTWARDIHAMNSQLIRDIGTTAEFLEKEAIPPSGFTTLKDIRYELTEMERDLLTLSKEPVALSNENVRAFLNHYHRFPNLMVNFLNSLSPNGHTSNSMVMKSPSLSSTATLSDGIHALLPARQTLRFLSHIQDLPKGPFLGELTSEYHRWIQDICGDLHSLYFYSKFDLTWSLDSSMAFQNLSYILRDVSRISQESNHPKFLQNELMELHSQVESLIKELSRVVQDPLAHPLHKNPEVFINLLHQTPSSFGDFLLDSDFHQLISARRFTREAQKYLEHSENSDEIPISR